MLARDIMSSPAITVGLCSPVAEVAATLRDHRIGGVPVLDGQGKLAEMVTEVDLVHRYEIGTDGAFGSGSGSEGAAGSPEIARIRENAARLSCLQ